MTFEETRQHISAAFKTGWVKPASVVRDVTTNEAGDTQSVPMDSTGLIEGMLMLSGDFPGGTTITQIENPGQNATVHFSQGKITTGTTLAVSFIAPPFEFLPVEYENVAFQPPANAVWCRFSILSSERADAAIGVAFKRNVGVVMLQIFTPKDGGTKAANEATDKLASILDNASIAPGSGDIQFQTVSQRTVGLNRDGWHQKNAWCEFRVDT